MLHGFFDHLVLKSMTLSIFFKFTAKLPKWFGERPGKKSGDPDSPDEDEDVGAGDAPVEDYAEEEEEEEEEEVNFIFKTKHSIPIIYSNFIFIVPM